VAKRVALVRERIAAAALRAGREPSGITLIAVSKTQPARAIAEVIAAGIEAIGENRVQEAAPKIEVLRASHPGVRWHLIGHLQRNKAAAAVQLFDMLHGVDSEPLARAISARATRTVPILLEVNVAGEATKFGASPRDAARLADRIGGLPHIDLQGLMTVAPQAEDPDEVRPVFRALRELRDAIGLRELSMGMSDDFEVAIEEGATMVRIGRAIFGDRRVHAPAETA
jgi:hypothetical protein